MSISLGNAISSIKEEPKWISKCVIGALIGYVIPFVIGAIQGFLEATSVLTEGSLVCQIIVFTISLILGLYMSGFIYTTMNRVVNSSEPFKMAEWNEKNLLLTGLKVTLSCIGWILLTSLVFGLCFLIIFLGIAIVNALISALFNMFLNTDLQIITIFSGLICCVLGIIYGLYLAQFINTAFACFLKTLRFKDLIAYKKHFRIINENKHASWTLIGKNILFSLAIFGIVLALSVTIIGIVLLPFVCFAGYFVSLNLIAQYAKEIEIDKYLN
ncbi:DUF4013 domain-containing protein [bacterium]|nr:DUF4013 domain-containing protein [bacterium]